ncbi:UNVERIFIED_CONTAM: hypothetical protein PYX00_009361 [Menopon gallinae]|uniref:Protein CUSTOS n=1 Tax=Menopon gallinae TaxID=328185 RepID=A0AAW2HAS1_9NEOP
MSSSSEEENECLKEAVDPTFFSNDLFSSNKSPQETKEAPKLPPSLRHQQQPKSFNPLEIRVTPEFRAHVSKHLNKLLDRLIDYTNETQKTKCKSKHRSKNVGVKLLKTSKNFVNEEENNIDPSPSKKIKFNKRKRRRIDDDNDSGDEERRAREVAVSAEWLFSGQATEGWAPCTKGELEVISIKPSKNK